MITHPFHPDRGAEYSYVRVRVSWGEERVYYYRDGEQALSWLPLSWTDLLSLDAFEQQSSGRAHFRASDLLAARRFLDGREEC